LCPGSDFSLVVVEGCPKAMKRYAKLMLRRIDWTAAPLPLATDMDQETHRDGDNGEAPDRPPNSCHLVWEVSTAAPRSMQCGGGTLCRVATTRQPAMWP